MPENVDLTKGESFLMDRLPKKSQATYIGYDEESDEVELRLYNRKQKNEFLKFCEEHPDLCRQTDDDGFGGLWFLTTKDCIVIKPRVPESEKTKQRRRENLKNNLNKLQPDSV